MTDDTKEEKKKRNDNNQVQEEWIYVILHLHLDDETLICYLRRIQKATKVKQ